MERAMERGKPLRARRVAEIVGEADALRAAVVNRNAEVATSYFGQAAIGSNRSLLEEGLERESRNLFPADPDILSLVDAGRLSRLVENEIRAAGNDGAHLVTTREAEQILSRVLNRELRAAYDTAQRRAVNRLSFENPYSISRQAFAAALAGSERALNIDPNRIEADLNDALHSRFEDAVASRLKASELDDESALRALADEVMEGFVAERTAAHEAISGLPIDSAAKTRMLAQALHDDIRADMVPAMGRACLQVHDDLAELGKPLGTAELQEPLSHVCDAMTSAFRESGVRVTASNQDAMYRSFWRFLLAPGGEAHAYTLGGRMAGPESALRALGQGAAWFRSGFAETEEGSRTVKDADGREQLEHAASFDAASRYAVMMENLAKVLRDRTGAPAEAFGLSEDGHSLRPRVRHFDDSIATLRNLGMEMPSPEPAGRVNPLAPVSQPALDLLREEVDRHIASVDRKLKEDVGNKLVRDGILAESTLDHARATYRVDGERLVRDEAVVANALRDFCADEHGRLNEEMLLGVSKVAFQAIPNGALAVLSNPANVEVSPLEGSPTFVQDAHRVEYNLSRNDRNEVSLNVRFWSPVLALRNLRDHRFDDEALDPDRSEVELSLDLKLDARSFRPTLEAARVGFARFSGPAGPGR